MPFQTLLAACGTEYQEKYIETFRRAYQQAQKLPQTRLSGEPFSEHNLRVAVILAENKASPEAVTAALLHSLPDEIIMPFGKDVLSLVQGLKEIKNIKAKKLEAESLRRILLMTLKDVRVILIKLAIKLDNLRTITALPPEEQRRIAQETFDLYAPLASRLGMERLRVQLEDEAFHILFPEKWKQINGFLQQTKEARDAATQEAITIIGAIASGAGIPIVKIKGRSKHLYSIYRKMTQRGVPLQEQYDLIGVRIIVPEEKDCYMLLGLLHEKLEPVPGRLKDYLAHPKNNLYRSLHTAVRIQENNIQESKLQGKIVEVQIRTPAMDEFAEEGIAAHWRYKGLKSEEAFEKKTAWLRSILALEEGRELLETAKIDVFADTIHTYTPKGDVKELPQGASVLDFAYSVHEQVGNHAVGAKVNGKFVPLKHRLHAGDVVEILTNKSQRPRRGWLKLVLSAKSKQKIRKSLTEYEKLAPTHYRVLRPVAEEQGILAESPEFPRAACTLAQCCQPLPGEEIAGLVTKRRVVSVHRKDCRMALKEEERWVKVQWKNTFNQKIRFYVLASERSGLLAEILHTIVRAGFNVQEAKGKLIGTGHVECSFAVIPRDLEHLKELVRKVQKVKGVKRVYFE